MRYIDVDVRQCDVCGKIATVPHADPMNMSSFVGWYTLLFQHDINTEEHTDLCCINCLKKKISDIESA